MIQNRLHDKQKLSKRSIISSVLVYAALISITFPAPFLFKIGDWLVFLHYFVFVIAIPYFLLIRKFDFYPIFITCSMIFISILYNSPDFSPKVAFFHLYHLLAIAVLASSTGSSALKFAKFACIVYVFVILLSQVFILFGLHNLIDGLFVVSEKTGALRVSALATEPAFAGLVMLILGRYILIHDPVWMTSRRLALILIALLLTQSFFSLLSGLLLLTLALRRTHYPIVRVGVFVAAGLAISVIATSAYFTQRVEGIDASSGVMGLGSGTIRILPFLYLFELIPQNPMALVFGGGAGAFQVDFFAGMGQYYTDNEQLSGHMAAIIYDYGLAAVIPFLFWNRPKGLFNILVYIGLLILVFLNTGIGSYLFILFGIYSLVEQGERVRVEKDLRASYQQSKGPRL